MIKQEPDKEIIEKIIFLFNKKKYLEALNLSNKIINKYPNSILINNILGVIHTELKNYTLAKNLFIKVINLNPKYNDGYYNLANIYNKIGEEDNAIKNYERVIELDSNYYKAVSIFVLIFGILDNFGYLGGRNGFIYFENLGKQDVTFSILFFISSFLMFFLF